MPFDSVLSARSCLMVLAYTLTSLGCKTTSGGMQGSSATKEARLDTVAPEVIFDFGTGKVNSTNTGIEYPGLSVSYKGGEGGLVNTRVENGSLVLQTRKGGGSPNDWWALNGVFIPTLKMPAGYYALEVSGKILVGQVYLSLGQGIDIPLTMQSYSDADAWYMLEPYANFLAGVRGKTRVWFYLPRDSQADSIGFKETGQGTDWTGGTEGRALDLIFGRLIYHGSI